MEDNILEEIRICSHCGTRTFCDYCPKCSSKMPASKSMEAKPFWKRSDMDRYRAGQAQSHSKPGAAATSMRTKAISNKASTHIYAEDDDFEIRKFGSHNKKTLQGIIRVIIFIFIFFILFIFPIISIYQ